MAVETGTLSLSVRRTIRASQRRVYEAWTQPAHLMQWWGPGPVSCPEAAVDLRVGGEYRIGNQMPSGAVLWIRGTFEVVEPYAKLVYSWTMDANAPARERERVTVEFHSQADGRTEVVVQHERIADEPKQVQHLAGWGGCLDGLEGHFAA